MEGLEFVEFIPQKEAFGLFKKHLEDIQGIYQEFTIDIEATLASYRYMNSKGNYHFFKHRYSKNYYTIKEEIEL